MAHGLRWHRLARVVFAAAAVTVAASTARADVDMTGYWWVHETFGTLEAYQVQYWVQSGTSISQGGFTGMIDPSTGVFTMSEPSEGGICPDDTWTGTAALDNQSWTGFVVYHIPGPPTFCFGGIGYQLSAVRIPANCGNGVVDPGERCDDGNLVAGDGCNPLCQIETCYICSGAPSTCVLAPIGSACSDGNACTVNACDGSGTCTVTGSTDCDDGNPCTVDSCDAMSGCVHSTDIRSCRSAHVNTLGIGVKDPSKEKLKWRWMKGESTDLSDFGTPTGTTAYTLCIFAGTTGAVVAAAEVPPDAQKWSVIPPSRVKYKDVSGAADGLTQMQLFAGAVGKSKIKVDGKGAGPLLSAPPYDLPLSIQLTNSSTNVCWSATFDALDVKHNELNKFGAKSKLP